jgi:hypothetical protein
VNESKREMMKQEIDGGGKGGQGSLGDDEQHGALLLL